MNIYKKQMNQLGLNIREYSKLLGVPEEVIRKNINGKGEVVKNMDINNFLKKNLFIKHQEVEENKEQKKMEALDIKLSRGENSFENKKIWLLEKYPESKEVNWYVNEYDRDTYFEKYGIKNKFDLMRKCNFRCDAGRLRYGGEVGESTIDRLTKKEYKQLGKDTAYSLICQLYNFFVLGKNKEEIKTYEKNEDKNIGNSYQDLKEWYDNFDFKSYFNNLNKSSAAIAREVKVSPTTIKAIKTRKYRPSNSMILKMKKYVEKNSKKNKYIEVPKKDEEKIVATSEEINIPMIPSQEEEFMKVNENFIMRNLLKDRLTEEERTLIRIFGGQI